MLSRLPAFLTGSIALFLYALNIIVCGSILFTLFFLKCISPFKSWRNYFNRLIFAIPSFWVDKNDRIVKLTSRAQWEIHLPEGLNPKQCYVITANHQSWADIIVLFSVFNNKIPILKYFLKKQLFWLPFVGLACWIYGFPFMHRYTKAQLEKNPELRGKDYESARKACERFKKDLGSVVNFSEGTRFRPSKHKHQQSPYQYLLKPKGGGLALALNAMGELVDTLLNVTIIYTKNKSSFWQFCCGKFDKIIVHVEKIPVTDDLRGNYQEDAEFRQHFQRFMTKLWHHKDELIKQYYDK